MIVYDQVRERWWDNETGEWYDAATGRWVPAAQQAATAGGLLSPGQALAAVLMLPLIVIWVADQYGVDLLAWVERVGR